MVLYVHCCVLYRSSKSCEKYRVVNGPIIGSEQTTCEQTRKGERVIYQSKHMSYIYKCLFKYHLFILMPYNLFPYNYGSVRGSPNGTIGNFNDGTIGSQWYHWLTNGTVGLPMVPIVPLREPMVPLALPFVQMALPMVQLVKP